MCKLTFTIALLRFSSLDAQIKEMPKDKFSLRLKVDKEIIEQYKNHVNQKVPNFAAFIEGEDLIVIRSTFWGGSQ